MSRNFEDRKRNQVPLRATNSRLEQYRNRPSSLYQRGIIIGAWKSSGLSEQDLRNVVREKFGKRDLFSLTYNEADDLIVSIKRDSSG